VVGTVEQAFAVVADQVVALVFETSAVVVLVPDMGAWTGATFVVVVPDMAVCLVVASAVVPVPGIVLGTAGQAFAVTPMVVVEVLDLDMAVLVVLIYLAWAWVVGHPLL
jgi:hypothetical protein